MRRICAGVVLAGLWGAEAPAQDWVTPESCAVTAEAMARAAMPPEVAAEIVAAAQEVANPVGRLWKITTPEGTVSHLWGTFHSPDPLILDLPLAFRAILARARVVALEFDPVPDSREEAARDAATDWMWLTEAAADWSFVPAEEMAWITARLEAIGWGTGYLDQLSVAGLASLLLGDPCSDFLAGVLPGQDGYIGQIGYLAGAEVTGLQRWPEFGTQMNDVARAEAARAVIVLYASTLGPGDATRVGDDTPRALAFRLYAEGRTAELDLYSESWLIQRHGAAEAARLAAQAEGYLVVERNVLFTAAALPLIAAGDAVIAVGAGHLAGRTGMIEMLRAEGLAVERVVLPGEAP